MICPVNLYILLFSFDVLWCYKYWNIFKKTKPRCVSCFNKLQSTTSNQTALHNKGTTNIRYCIFILLHIPTDPTSCRFHMAYGGLTCWYPIFLYIKLSANILHFKILQVNGIVYKSIYMNFFQLSLQIFR